MACTFAVAVDAMDGPESTELVDFLATTEELSLSRSEAETKVSDGGTVLRTTDPTTAQHVRGMISEFGADTTVVCVGPEGEKTPVEEFYRVKGSITGGAPPEDATVAASNAEGLALTTGEVFSDRSYDVRYPLLEAEEFELTVRLLNPSGETVAAADPVRDPDPIELVDIEITFGDAAPVTEGEDFQNFMLVKPTGVVEAEAPDPVTVDHAMSASLKTDLREAKEAGDGAAMTERAGKFVASDQFVDDLGSVPLPLESFADEVRGVDSVADLKHTVEATFEAPPSELVFSPSFREAREQVADSLAAATLADGDHEATIRQLEEGMRLFSLIESAAEDDESLNTHGAVRRALDRSVTLPESLFPLPKSRVRPQRVGGGSDGGQIPSAAEELLEVRAARENLVTSMFRGTAGPRQTGIEEPEDIDPDERDGWNDDELDDDPLSDGGSADISNLAIDEVVPETTMESITSLGVNAGSRPSEALSVLESRERQLGEELQYDLLDGPGTVGPHSEVTLLERSVGAMDQARTRPELEVAPFYPVEPHINPLGVADLQTMRKTLDRYDMGEIAHIENVLEGERRKRKHRNLERTEETVTTETEKVKEKKRSLETTERFEMETETSETVQQEQSIDTGVQISASYGPTVEMKAHANYNRRTAKTETKRSSQRFAREITKKTVDRIKRRVEQRRRVTEVEETEETNVHEIDNSEADDHVIGIYRYLDKFYDAQVFNHGERMLLEFIVPEPAAFFRYSRATDAAEEVDMERPTPPVIDQAVLDLMENPRDPEEVSDEELRDPTSEDDSTGEDDSSVRALRPTDLHGWNYTYYAKQYGADVSPPPRKYRILSKSISVESSERETLWKSKSISIPDGYAGIKAIGNTPRYETYADPEDAFLTMNIGHADFEAGRKNLQIRGDMLRNWIDITQLAAEQSYAIEGDGAWTDSVPITVYVEPRNTGGFAVDATVLCRRTQQHYEQWQLDTFGSIMEAYRNERSEYEERVAAQEIQGGVEISGQNPERNREIERTELKRLMMAMLKDSPLHPEDIEDEASSTSSPVGEEDGGDGVTEASIKGQADTIRFLEQAFEWPEMTYRFYPYYWADEAKWPALSRLEAKDPTFASFLRAGAARVVVPVRPGYKYEVPHFMRTGEPYIGDDRPSVGDPTYQSIIDAIKENQNKLPEDATPVKDPWKVKVPTSLVKLQQGGSLDAGGD